MEAIVAFFIGLLRVFELVYEIVTVGYKTYLVISAV